MKKKIDKLRENSEFNSFYNEIIDYDPIIYGGFVRDHLAGTPPNDLDIVLMDCKLLILSRQYKITFNKFGGLRLRVGEIDVDLWRIEDTKWIKELNLEPTIENLFKHTNREENKIIYNIRTDQIIKYEKETIT